MITLILSLLALFYSYATDTPAIAIFLVLYLVTKGFVKTFYRKSISDYVFDK